MGTLGWPKSETGTWLGLGLGLELGLGLGLGVGLGLRLGFPSQRYPVPRASRVLRAADQRARRCRVGRAACARRTHVARRRAAARTCWGAGQGCLELMGARAGAQRCRGATVQRRRGARRTRGSERQQLAVMLPPVDLEAAERQRLHSPARPSRAGAGARKAAEGAAKGSG